MKPKDKISKEELFSSGWEFLKVIKGSGFCLFTRGEESIIWRFKTDTVLFYWDKSKLNSHEKDKDSE